jgi:hypothetical protein
LNSYLTFCRTHGFNIDPTPDTLNFFVVYMTLFIKPQSISAYLSGIVSTLEPYYPDVQKNCNSTLVTSTLIGCTKLRGSETSRKLPLSSSDLQLLYNIYGTSPNHDDRLFLAITFIGFHGLMCLGELVAHDNLELRSSRKVIKRHTVMFRNNPPHVSFNLPMHKADRCYATITIVRGVSSSDPLNVFQCYLMYQDEQHKWHPLLWLRESGMPPTRFWCIRRLRLHFPSDFAGHSLCSGGATGIALANIPAGCIRLTGRWSSDTFQIYIRKNPVLLNAIISGGTAPDHSPHN